MCAFVCVVSAFVCVYVGVMCVCVCVFSHLTGASFFSSFFPLDKRPFLFLLESWLSWRAREVWPWAGPWAGLMGLMVPGRRG